MPPEVLKNRAIPCLLDSVGPQVYRPPQSLVVEAAWHHLHVWADISGPTGSLAGVCAALIYQIGIRDKAWDGA